MKIVDAVNPQRINRNPDQNIVLFCGRLVEKDLIIHKVELRLYLQKTQQKLGKYQILTIVVQTDRGEVEMIYDEGFRGDDHLKKTADFLTNTGLGSIITRCKIVLDSSRQ